MPLRMCFKDCDICPEMVVIPAGEFVMGSPESETTREAVPAEFARWERPQHTVRVERAFSLGKYEVTRAEFAAFVRETGHEANGCWVGTDNPEIRWIERLARSDLCAGRTGTRWRACRGTTLERI